MLRQDRSWQELLTLFLVMAPTIRGHTMPDRVPTPLEMPMRILAYRGAMSKWLTLNPENEKVCIINLTTNPVEQNK